MKAIKLSEKQQQILQHLHEREGSNIILIKGLNAHCHITKSLNTIISMSTLKSLRKSGLVEEIKADHKSAYYTISQLGKISLTALKTSKNGL